MLAKAEFFLDQKKQADALKQAAKDGTHSPHELAPWFNGISAFLVENLEAGGCHEFSLDGGQLSDRAAAR